MRRILSILLLVMFAFSLSACDTKSMNYIIENKPSVIGTVEEVHDNYIIMVSDSATGYPNGSRWQISLDVENKDSYTNPTIGDEIVVYHDGNVMETYPLRVGKVIAITLKTPADRKKNEAGTLLDNVELTGVSEQEIINISVSYANWTEESKLYFGALNKDKMAISSVLHLPIYKFDTFEELNQFKEIASEILTLDVGHDEVPSFNDTTADYNESFFEDNTLVLVYVTAGSGTYRFGVNSIYCKEGSFCVQIKQLNHPEIVTCDMAGWFITVVLPDDAIENCTEFDAILSNSES